MGKSRPPDIKKTGRPSTGIGTPVLVRLDAAQLAQVDKTARKAKVSRPEAIRRLISQAVKGEGEKQRSSREILAEVRATAKRLGERGLRPKPPPVAPAKPEPKAVKRDALTGDPIDLPRARPKLSKSRAPK